METSVYYNRGIQDAAVHIEAVRTALTLTGGKPPTGADVKKGFEMIKDFTLGGLLPPLQVTPSDHEGGGFVQIFQVKGDKMVKETDWFNAYRDLVLKAWSTPRRNRHLLAGRSASGVERGTPTPFPR